jgi:UDP-N-acetylglucosamine:LPS N-acetylglucosamine transferase
MPPRTVVSPLVDESRILVISASMGGGHDGAGRELVRRLGARGHEALMVDFLSAFPLRTGWLVRFGYWLELRFAPWSYDATYRLWYRMPFAIQPLAAFINLLTSRRVLRWVREANADVVVSTYPMASLVLGRARQRGKLGAPVATFITDFAVHPLWTHPGVDLHLCVHEQSAEAAAARSGRAATAPGPMVPDRFHADLPDRHAARQALGFDDDERLVLVVAGAWGIGDVAKTFDEVLSSGFTPVVVCGNNEQLRRKLENRRGGHVLGWTDEMPTLMAAADVLVQNAGGLTCMEAFAAGLPVVSFEPIAGHGKDNAEKMAEAGVAAYATSAEELSPVLERATSLVGRAMTSKGRAMFVADPAGEVSALAAAHAPQPVLERTRARVGVRRITAGVAALASTYAAFTVGVGAAAAHGIGVAHAPRNTGAVYLAVRLGPNDINDANLPAALKHAHATAIVPGMLAAHQPGAVKRLQAAGVEMANGGWGRRDRVHWGRARSDLMRAPKAIHAATGQRTHDFVPQRRIDGFDLASARLVHERVVVPSVVLTPGDSVAKLHAGQVVVLDGRGETAAELLQGLADIENALASAGLTPASLAQMH